MPSSAACFREAHHLSKLTDKDVSRIREIYEKGGVSQYDVARDFGVTQAVISQVIRRAGPYTRR